MGSCRQRMLPTGGMCEERDLVFGQPFLTNLKVQKSDKKRFELLLGLCNFELVFSRAISFSGFRAVVLHLFVTLLKALPGSECWHVGSACIDEAPPLSILVYT